jgi:hypothetical protein
LFPFNKAFAFRCSSTQAASIKRIFSGTPVKPKAQWRHREPFHNFAARASVVAVNAPTFQSYKKVLATH